jgi:2,4-dienoyl-CoA reductase (NADPH2)
LTGASLTGDGRQVIALFFRPRPGVVNNGAMSGDPIFEPLHFAHLAVKNRLIRSNVSGRFDNYDGSGGATRIRWEESFARGGVGAIVSSHTPVHIRGRVMPGYAMMDRDDRIPFWREVGRAVHRHDCRFVVQLTHAGRQQDIPGIENRQRRAMSSTGKTDSFHGFRCRPMTTQEIGETVGHFASAARRVREAGLDGVELHANNGYLITQFLSSAINDRRDEYGGTLENRARFLLEIVAAIRKAAGRDFHLQVKINAEDVNNALAFWEKPGNTLADTVQVCKWLEAAGVDALHISNGNSFPHPLQPPGPLPLEEAAGTYGAMLASGTHTFRNYLFFRFGLLRPMLAWLWNRVRPSVIEGANIEVTRTIKQSVGIPVICNGGLQTASLIRSLLHDGVCDAVSIARPLIANRNLPMVFLAGHDRPVKPCTHCNKCTVNVLLHPLGCYEVSRYDGDYDAMVKEILSVFEPGPVEEASAVPS